MSKAGGRQRRRGLGAGASLSVKGSAIARQDCALGMVLKTPAVSLLG